MLFHFILIISKQRRYEWSYYIAQEMEAQSFKEVARRTALQMSIIQN